MFFARSVWGVSAPATAWETKNRQYPPRITVLGFHWYANPRCGENCFQGLSCANRSGRVLLATIPKSPFKAGKQIWLDPNAAALSAGRVTHGGWAIFVAMLGAKYEIRLKRSE